MKKITLAVFLLMLFSPVLVCANDDDAIKDQINIKVTQLASLLQDFFAREYPKYREIKIIRNEHDNTIVAITTFDIEGFGGANNAFIYLAVFANNGDEEDYGKPKDIPKTMRLLDFVAVGGHAWRSIDFKQIQIDRKGNELLITLPTLENGANDAHCCPSVKSKVQFTIDLYNLSGLKEIK